MTTTSALTDLLSIGSNDCDCNAGYTDGLKCTDINECKEGIHNCDHNAKCFNSVGGVDCTVEMVSKVIEIHVLI